MKLSKTVRIGLPAALASSVAIAGGGDPALVTFDAGAEGWIAPNGAAGGPGTSIEAGTGNPGACWRTQFTNFGLVYSTESNPAFLGDLSASPDVSIGLDVQVNQIFFTTPSSPVPRDMWVFFYNEDAAAAVGAFTAGVAFRLGVMPGTGQPWTSWDVAFDPSSTDLPPGWVGIGDEDPMTFEPVLPAGVTFADIFENVTRVEFSTFTPGFFFGFTTFDIRLDNLRITRGPLPCNVADIAAEFGVLNANDVIDFVNGFNAQEPIADVSPPGGNGLFNVNDVIDFINAFNAGCP